MKIRTDIRFAGFRFLAACFSGVRNRLFASIGAGIVFAAGFGTAVLARGPLKTYSTRGVLVQNTDGKVVLKDKFGATWEYTAPAASSSAAVGKQVKVTYTMNAQKIEAE